MRRIAVALAATVIGLAPAAAQNFGLQPTFGSVSLSAGFTPDPHSVGVIAGGPIDAFSAVGAGCAGNIADAPDFRLSYSAGGLPLIISAISSSDTTLVINDPNGSWVCDDDSGGNLNPQVTFNNPPTGTYDIWVGTFGGGTASATIEITEVAGGGGGAPPVAPPPGGGGAGAPPAGGGFPNVGLQPAFGTVVLSTGFFPDPHSVAVTAGGSISANGALGGNCFGDIAEAPDIRLDFLAGNLPLVISAMSSSDTTLVINDPSGNWVCDDDSGGNLNPEITFNNPSTGVYDIWVGTFGGSASATLNISELGGGGAPPAQPPAGGGGAPPAAGGGFPDISMQPAFGSVTLNTGFFPDPHTVAITAGGAIDANSALGGSCFGSIAEAPDFRLDFGAGSLPLIISAISSTDTTLVINDPNGNWVCDDDSGGNLNPEITFNNPSSGIYDIWIGTFGGGAAAATLNISELGGNPPPGGGGAPPAAGGGFPDVTMQPAFGSVTLNAGFVPDPHTVSIIAGGPIDAFNALGGSCVGNIAEAPDFRLNYTGAAGFQLIISAFSSSDTTLVINDPFGEWFCVDDANGLDPEVVFDMPSRSGTYDIWIGTFSTGTADATLEISEFVQSVPAPAPQPPAGGGGKPAPVPPAPAPQPPPPVQGNMPNFNLQPAFGNAALTSGFMPDPNETAIIAGGPIDAFDALGGNCFGNIAEAPDFRINYTAGNLPLIISTISASDTTLVVNDPNGNWVCDDDSAGNLNAAVRFNNPTSGQYDVWVGTFGAGTADATLLVSEKGP